MLVCSSFGYSVRRVSLRVILVTELIVWSGASQPFYATFNIIHQNISLFLKPKKKNMQPPRILP